MKKFFYLVVLSLFFLGGEIKANEPIRFGVVAGLNNNKFSSVLFKSKLGFHAGVKAELNLRSKGDGIYVDAAALISLKGSKVVVWEDEESMTYNPYYLEVPIHVGYKYAVNDKFSLLGNFGPYIGYGIMGKVEGLDATPSSADVFSNEFLTRFDYGFGFRIGVELKKKIQVTVGYDYGLGDLSDTYSIQNRNLTLSVAFMF